MGKRVTYGRLICDIKEHKYKNHQTQLTVGGNLLDLPGLLSTPTETITTAKCLFNSVIYTPGAKCLVTDVKHFYLNNDLPNTKYMKLHLHIRPPQPSGQRRMGIPQYLKINVWIKASRYHRQHGTHQTP